MIEAEFARKGDGLSLKMNGHAEYGDGGADIVCAAVSGIFYALVGYIKNECRELKINALCAGDADIECSSDAIEAMRLAYIGFLQIALTYPGTVGLKDGIFGIRANAPIDACI